MSPDAPEYPLNPVVGATKTPALPVLQAGKDHLDIDPDTTVEQLCDTVRSLDRDILAVFDARTMRLTHAPIVADGESVNWEPFEDALRGRLVVHNHPTGKHFSPADLATCYTLGLAGLVAALPAGGHYAVLPKGKRWRGRQEVMGAINDAAKDWLDWVAIESREGRPPSASDRRAKYNTLVGDALAGKPIIVERTKVKR